MKPGQSYNDLLKAKKPTDGALKIRGVSIKDMTLSKLQLAALKAFPSSPIQKEIHKEIQERHKRGEKVWHPDDKKGLKKTEDDLEKIAPVGHGAGGPNAVGLNALNPGMSYKELKCQDGGFKTLGEDTEQGRRLKVKAAKLQAEKELKAKNPNVNWDEHIAKSQEEEARLNKSVYKVPVKIGLEHKVYKNPSPGQARKLFENAKGYAGQHTGQFEVGQKYLRYFGDPEGNLHMWEAHNLTHGHVMDHLGIAGTSDNYAGAGVVGNADDAERIARNFLKKSEQSCSDERKEVSSVAVMDSDGKILMGKRRDSDRWTLPGGHLDEGEHHLDGAVRELMEEAGIEAKHSDMQHLVSEDVTTHTGKPYRIHAYRVVVPAGTATSMQDDPDKEVHRWTWIDTKGGLPHDVRENLHSPKNTVLAALGLMTENPFAKAAGKLKDLLSKGEKAIENIDQQLDNYRKPYSSTVKNKIGERRILNYGAGNNSHLDKEHHADAVPVIEARINALKGLRDRSWDHMNPAQQKKLNEIMDEHVAQMQDHIALS